MGENMGIVQKFIKLYRKKCQEKEEICNRWISYIDIALFDRDSIFSTSGLINPNVEKIWNKRHNIVLDESKAKKIKRLKKTAQYQSLCLKQAELFNSARLMPHQIYQHNEKVIEEAYSLIGNISGKELDKQQMTCIVKEAHNHLIIAGAGTGKTTIIIGKIKYLLKKLKYLPQDILVISFTRATTTEMKERIAIETECNIAICTFHKLGLNIISEVNGTMPKITQISLREFIKKQLVINMQSDEYLDLLNSYLLYNRVVAKSEFDFASQKEYDEYLKMNPPTTIQHEIVKSYGEMDIANFLMQNGIRYIYEAPYEFDVRTEAYGQYHPDFYLPDYKIYIEYFGINEKGEVPSYFSSANGKTATEAYRASMKWKRTIHRKYKTKMIECYAYEKSEGNLLNSLTKKLKDSSVILKPRPAKELWAQVNDKEDFLLESLAELFETLINLIKSNGYDISTVQKLNYNRDNVYTNKIILLLLEPIFNAYCQYLTTNNEIDFNDMINLASEYVRQGKYTNPYKYVIVDEYQDISKANFSLLDSLRKSKDYELFCVGDDWQSIYRFTGSDIGFILNFSKYWGETEISKIETTYRFSQKMAEISSNFIMQNPLQIKKNIQGKSETKGFPLGEISGYTDKNVIKFMAAKLYDLPKGSTVYFIGRYSFDNKILSDSGLFACKYNNITGFIDVKSKMRTDLNIIFLTAHKAKGLQADYVFIINNRKSKMGFPSKIQDAPILDLLLEHCEQYPYAEERRLFYVALTRAKKKTFIVTINGQESEFALELKQNYEHELKREQFECPVCGGQLRKKISKYGEFFGCSNYYQNGCTYKRKIG